MGVMKWEADLVFEALRKSPIYSDRSWIVLPQVRDATGAGVGRTADGLAMNAWPSRGLEVHGFEIKVHRHDWLRELKQPEKAESIFRYCDRWWIVVPEQFEDQAAEIVKLEELPPTWGLLKVAEGGKSIRTARQAPKLKPRPLDRVFVAAVLRAVQGCATPAAAIAAARLEGIKQGQKEGEENARRRLEFGSKRDEITWKRESLRSIEKYADRLRDEARKAIRECDQDLEGVESLAGELVRMRQALESIVALDFKKDDAGRDDFYSGPGVFLSAHKIAREALGLSPDGEPAPADAETE